MPFRLALLKLKCDARRESPMITRNIREARGLPPLSVLDISEYGPGDDGDSNYSSTGLPSFSGWEVDSPLYRYQPMYYCEKYMGDPQLCLRPSVDYKIKCGKGSPLAPSSASVSPTSSHKDQLDEEYRALSATPPYKRYKMSPELYGAGSAVPHGRRSVDY